MQFVSSSQRPSDDKSLIMIQCEATEEVKHTWLSAPGSEIVIPVGAPTSYLGGKYVLPRRYYNPVVSIIRVPYFANHLLTGFRQTLHLEKNNFNDVAGQRH